MNAKQATDELEEFYGRKLPPGAFRKWAEKLKFVHEVDLGPAVDEITSKERQFPTPEVVLRYVDEARARRSSRAQQQEKQVVREFFEPSKHKSEIAKDSVEFMNLLFKFPAGSKDRFGFIVSTCESLNHKYPQAGWFNEMYYDAKRELIKLEDKERNAA